MSKSVYENNYEITKPDFIVISTPLSKKLRHSEFNSSESKTVFDGILKKNPRSSFHAQKLRKNQSRPQSSFPDPNQNQLRIQQPKNIGVMGSFFINTKPNTRRISNSLASYQAQLMKRNQSQNGNDLNLRNNKVKSQRTPVSSNIINASLNVNVCQRTSAKKAPVNIYDDIFNQVSCKYKKFNQCNQGERRYVISQCKTRDIERQCDGQLTITGIKPNKISYQGTKKNLKSEEFQETRYQNSSNKMMTQQISTKNECQKAMGRHKYQNEKREQNAGTIRLTKSNNLSLSPKKNSPKKQSYVIQYFGKVKQNMGLDEIQRLKAMYYRDFIWKNWFNSGWKIKVDSYSNGSLETPKYFVGKGNNSKLIKMVMGRRWWWKLETKEQNANFLWTQLKIYSVYQSQVEYKRVGKFEADDNIIQKQCEAEASSSLFEEFVEKKSQQGKQIQNSSFSESTNLQLGQSNQSTEDQKYFSKQLGLPSSKFNDENRQTGTHYNSFQVEGQQKTMFKSFVNQVIFDEDWWVQKAVFDDKNTHLLTYRKYKKWQSYIKNFHSLKREAKSTQNLQCRKALQNSIEVLDRYPNKVTNHLQYSRLIGNKKALYKTLSLYYELSKKFSKFLPNTFHISTGIEDKQYTKFLKEYYRRSKQQNNTMWIVKPGEMSNRGCGIKVCQDVHQIKAIIKNPKTHNNGKPFTYIIQEYLREPFLYQGRKFDVRHYIMINSNFGRIKGYFYQDGYIRTTSYKYSNKTPDAYIHLTNDAVQKHCKDYGKYEKGNKLSYDQFQKYLQSLPQAKQRGYSFYEKIHPSIRQISIDIMNSCYYLIDPRRKGNNFEIFGLDIMIDSQFKPWLIEVNTNPCLQLSSPVLAKIIPKMLDNALAISLDPLFPPPADILIGSRKTNLPENYISENRFELVFDEIVEGKKLNRMYEEIKNQLPQMEGYGSDQQAYQSAEDGYNAQY